MQIIEYPIFCWNLSEKTVIGHLLGTDYQLVAENRKTLRAMFSEYVQKQLKTGSIYFFELEDYKVESFSFNVKPHYREGEKIYPTKGDTEVGIHAVFGENDRGFYECYLVELDRRFYYYDKKDLKKLVEHFSKNILQESSPSDICNLLLPSAPWLEKLPVKVPPQKSGKNENSIDYLSYKTLSAVGERLPFGRKEKTGIIPNAAWERGPIVDHIIRLMIDENLNVLLVGNSGVGKSAVIRETIRKAHSRQKSLKPWSRNSFWRTTPSRITAKAKYLGEWQLVCEDLIEELQEVNGIVWVENFVSLATTGGEGAEDSVAAFLRPFIRDGNLQLISEVTPPQLEAMRRLLPGFVEHFRFITVEEMDRQTTMKVFQYFDEYIDKTRKKSFSQKALEMSYALLDRFIRYEKFPGKAVRFLSACVNKSIQDGYDQIEAEQVIEQFSFQTGMPEILLRDDILLEGNELFEFFSQKIKGQDHVIRQICSLIKVFKAGLNDPQKPIGTMIFAGPTGVGKTATAKAISDYLFGIGQAYKPFVRLDMSEFQHPSQIYRLIGPDGKLIRHVREKPFGVVLFDEIEKANPMIFDALLTVLDEGMLIDASGRLTDFRNTIIIMTSNLGANQRSSLGFNPGQNQSYEADIRAFFRPEFFNRIDHCLVFQPLEEAIIREIALAELNDIQTREGIRQRTLTFSFTENLIAFVVSKGFDPKYGARPLQREIERLVVAPLARMLVEDTKLKDKKVVVDYRDGVVFR